MARAGIVSSVTCEEILSEFDEKLRLRFGYTDQQALLAVNELRGISRVVAIAHQLKVVTADPDDDKIIECAVSGSASHIVTGDKRHLLPLDRYGAIEIVTPADFVALTRSLSPPP